MLYPCQGCDGAEAYPRNSGHEAGIHPRWDTSPLQDTKHTLIHAYRQSSIVHPPTDVTDFLLCLVEVHDAMDYLYRRVAAEERDLIWKLFGGRFGAFGGIDLLRFPAATFLCWWRTSFLLRYIYKKDMRSAVLDSFCCCSAPHLKLTNCHVRLQSVTVFKAPNKWST